MHTPETAGFEPATEQALGLLFVSAAPRLQVYGTFDDSGKSYGTQNALPLIGWGGAAYEFTAKAAVLHEVTPKAAEALELDEGGSIALSYIPQHYAHSSKAAHAYQAPECQFDLYRDATPVLSEALCVYLHYRQRKHDLAIMPVGIPDRYYFNEGEPVGPIRDTSKWLSDLVESESIKRQAGLDNISRGECAALQSIVNHLGIIAEKQVIQSGGETS